MEKEDGQVAYEAYRKSCPVSKFTGDKLPTWENIDPELKPYWACAEWAVKARFANKLNKIISEEIS